jgi:hypothetical protein
MSKVGLVLCVDRDSEGFERGQETGGAHWLGHEVGGAGSGTV